MAALKLGLTLSSQILSITCDNASNNDTMIEHLSTLVENFPGAANQTRCFTHILNLVAKSILAFIVWRWIILPFQVRP
jgi:hypothetical protein